MGLVTDRLDAAVYSEAVRRVQALLDRITYRAHIIETGNDSYRFRRTIEKRKKKE